MLFWNVQKILALETIVQKLSTLNTPIKVLIFKRFSRILQKYNLTNIVNIKVTLFIQNCGDPCMKVWCDYRIVLQIILNMENMY